MCIRDRVSTQSTGNFERDMDACDEEALVFGTNGKNVYCRSWSDERAALQDALLATYDLTTATHSAVVLPSGMAAISAVMSSVLDSHDQRGAHMIIGDELYCDVYRTAKYLEQSRPGLTVHKVDIRDGAALLKLFAKHKGGIHLLHIEACTNPSGQVFDFELLAEVKRRSPECVVVVDNTWLSSALFNPLTHGADLVVESMTKYVSGGRCIGGNVVGSHASIAAVETWIKVFGMYVAADHCSIFQEGLSTMQQRVRDSAANTLEVASHCEALPSVTRVLYPLLESHPTHELARRYLQAGGPGCFLVHLAASKKAVVKKAKKLFGELEYKTSFGGRKARVDPWPFAGSSVQHDGAPGEKNQSEEDLAGVAGTWVCICLLYTSPSPRDRTRSRMPSSA
eukprot:TRINITY_DN16268_c0_g2_i1.p2 TRINITY_DN16268_c0_g2~~TRINITY_DN16268_c0_g2_i1.p2  ORF type:complete len:396 (+),score=107.53 TRINITY_DN16268_c0_g2_i1:141-1328(+)